MAEAPEIPESAYCTSFTGLDFMGDHPTQCLMCSEEFLLPMKRKDLLSHLFIKHNIVIGKVDEIANIKGQQSPSLLHGGEAVIPIAATTPTTLQARQYKQVLVALLLTALVKWSYIDYWRIRFRAGPITRFSTEFVIEVNCEYGSSRKEYHYLLCDVLPEDKLLREGLHLKRLEWVLQQQDRERKRNVSRHCLLCQLDFTGPQADYFSHLSNKHHLKLGSPENLVFTDELLDVIDEKLNRKECLFCGRIFKSHHVLKDHMRKKQHKRINPNNKAFDKYFVINYLEIGKNWEQIQDEMDDSDSSEESSSWSDWEDDGENPPVVCLFCDHVSLYFESILDHMKSEHGFDYDEISRKPPLPFYEQVKLVNYIRQQVSHYQCPNCNDQFEEKDSLMEHMSNTRHFELPDKKLWEHPRYFFPQFDGDTFLCHLFDFEDSGED